MSPVPSDPFNFINGVTVVDGDNLDARFLPLYRTFDPAQIGIDDSNIKPLGVGTASLAALAVTAAKMDLTTLPAAQQAWQTISISGTNITTTNVGYFKDSLGIVHFRGDLVPVTNSVTDATVIGTLPAGFRPGTTSPQYFPYARQTGASAGTLTVTSAGAIAIFGMNPGGASGFYLSGIHLRAEN